MQNHSYDAELYRSILKSEVIKSSIIAIVLMVLFTSIIVYYIIRIKKDKAKKSVYVQLVVFIALFAFLSISVGRQIFAFSKDIVDETYIQYEGPATIKRESQISAGGITTSHSEYIISFKNNGETIELQTEKDYALEGNIDYVYIVYSQYSQFLLDLRTK